MAGRMVDITLALMSKPSITHAQLQEMLNRCNMSTAGPWQSFVEGRDHTSGSSFIHTAGPDIELSGASAADQDFIAHAKQDIPALVAEVLHLRGFTK